MADLQEVYGLLHVHEGLVKHGDMFPNLKSHVLNQLRKIEADHAPRNEPVEAAPEPEPTPEPESQSSVSQMFPAAKEEPSDEQ